MASIVVIDAEETVRSIVSKILIKAGHQVRATGDFDEAVTMLEDSVADMVVTNVFLRNISGRDAMAILKSRFSCMPVLMVSGLPDDESIREWRGEDRFDVFPKPFRSSMLVEKVGEMLAGRNAPRVLGARGE